MRCRTCTEEIKNKDTYPYEKRLGLCTKCYRLDKIIWKKFEKKITGAANK